MSRRLLKILAGWLLVIGLGILCIYLYEAFPDTANTYVEQRLFYGGWTVFAVGVIGLLYSSIKATIKWIADRSKQFPPRIPNPSGEPRHGPGQGINQGRGRP
jgi:hypothetical protein